MEMNYQSLAIVFYSVGFIAGIIVIYFTYKINKIKLDHANLESRIARKELEKLTDEANNRITILQKTNEITSEISHSISTQLIKDPSWLDRFMDQTGATYTASVYGKRIGHFFHEKSKISVLAINKILEYLEKNNDKQYCLLIDSGTTTYPVFQEIASRLRDNRDKKIWKERVCIVTNNIPGIQYIMKNAKEDPNDEYSELSVNCYIMPGKPLAVYAAITGEETEKWLGNIRAVLNNQKNWRDQEKSLYIIGFLTGNYLARSLVDSKPQFFPVARGEGHVEIKKKIVDVSDEIFLLSPLMKFTFANVELLNKVNDFTIERTDIEKALQKPKKVKYTEIIIPEKLPKKFFTTSRPTNAKFYQFGVDLRYELEESNKSENIIMNEYDVRYWAPTEDNSRLELEKEIPHDTLRKQFENGANIWDRGWVRAKMGSATIL